MRISNITEFRNIVRNSQGCVWMQDEHGMEYDLKSESGMRKVMPMLADPNNNLELYASNYNVVYRLVAFLIEQSKTA